MPIGLFHILLSQLSAAASGAAVLCHLLPAFWKVLLNVERIACDCADWEVKKDERKAGRAARKMVEVGAIVLAETWVRDSRCNSPIMLKVIVRTEVAGSVEG